MHSEVDAYDRRILALLQEDASLSSAQIAEQVGLSQSPCWRRIQRLKEEGVIRGQVMRRDRCGRGAPEDWHAGDPPEPGAEGFGFRNQSLGSDAHVS